MNVSMQDLLPNSPRYNGSKKSYMETVLPLAAVPFVLMSSALGLVMNIVVFTVLGMILLYMLQVYKCEKRTQFFYVWSLASGFYLFSIFEFLVIPFLAITILENLAFLIIFTILVYLFFKAKLLSNPEYESQNGSYKEYSIITSDVLHCQICKIEVRNQYFHTVWLDCCISRSNYLCYMAALILSDFALLYGANLAITSVCQPYFFWKTILMPEDCSDVYYEFDIAFCFVSAVYALCFASVITLALLRNAICCILPLFKIKFSKL